MAGVMGRAWSFGVLAEGMGGSKAGSVSPRNFNFTGLVGRVKVLRRMLWAFWEIVWQFLKKCHLE